MKLSNVGEARKSSTVWVESVETAELYKTIEGSALKYRKGDIPVDVASSN